MNGMELEKLGEILGSYVGAAAGSLGKLFNEGVAHKLHKTNVMEFSQLERSINAVPEQEIVAVYIKGEGDVRLGILLFLSEDNAKTLAARLLGSDTAEKLTALGKSAIAEMGNIILAGSFLNALSKATGFKVKASVPGLAIDMFRTLLEPPTIDVASETDQVIVAEAELTLVDSAISATVLIILDPHGAEKLLTNHNGG